MARGWDASDLALLLLLAGVVGFIVGFALNAAVGS